MILMLAGCNSDKKEYMMIPFDDVLLVIEGKPVLKISEFEEFLPVIKEKASAEKYADQVQGLYE
ncbi:MAG: hypothetical protein WC707_02390 [Candidatus Babeliaceae bacterium]